MCPKEAEIVNAANLASLIEVNEQQEDERKPLQRHQAAESVAGAPPEMVPESIEMQQPFLLHLLHEEGNERRVQAHACPHQGKSRAQHSGMIST